VSNYGHNTCPIGSSVAPSLFFLGCPLVLRSLAGLAKGTLVASGSGHRIMAQASSAPQSKDDLRQLTRSIHHTSVKKEKQYASGEEVRALETRIDETLQLGNIYMDLTKAKIEEGHRLIAADVLDDTGPRDTR